MGSGGVGRTWASLAHPEAWACSAADSVPGTVMCSVTSPQRHQVSEDGPDVSALLIFPGPGLRN